MHIQLTTSTQSLDGFSEDRTVGCTSSDSNTAIGLFVANSAGQSTGVQLLDERGRPVIVEAGTTMKVRDGSTFVAYALLRGSAPSAVWVDAPAVAVTAAATLAVFGDGSDGTVTFDGEATVLGLAPTDDVYTLTRDIFPANMTIAAGVTVKTAGFKIFCAGDFTIAATGVLSNNGNAGGDGSAGTGGTAGAISAAGSTAQGTAGGAGGSGNNAGAAGTANANGFPGGTGVGGAGGGDGTHSAAAAGAWTALAATKGGARHALALLAGGIFGTSAWSPFGGGSGGGGGGGDNADAGGGGGGGGGGVLILAAFNLTNNGSITATGGAGGDGASAANNAGGGGGGGGGVVALLYRTKSGSGTAAAAGGAGGAKAGSSGVAGSAGTAGVVVQVQV